MPPWHSVATTANRIPQIFTLSTCSDNSFAVGVTPLLEHIVLLPKIGEVHCQPWIELRARTAQDLIHGLARRSPFRIGTIRTDRIERVCDRDDSRCQRNRISLQAIGIALAIPSLVMTANTRLCKAEFVECADQAGPCFRMTAHQSELCIRQSPRLEENLIWNGQLAKIMDHRGGVHVLDLALIESKVCGK